MYIYIYILCQIYVRNSIMNFINTNKISLIYILINLDGLLAFSIHHENMQCHTESNNFLLFLNLNSLERLIWINYFFLIYVNNRKRNT